MFPLSLDGRGLGEGDIHLPPPLHPLPPGEGRFFI